MEKKGFVFVESLTVIIIVILSLTLLISSYGLVTRKSKENEYYDLPADKYLLYVIGNLGENNEDYNGVTTSFVATKDNCSNFMINRMSDCSKVFEDNDLQYYIVIYSLNLELNSGNPTQKYDSATIEYLKTLKKCNSTSDESCDDAYVVGVFKRNNKFYYVSLKVGTKEPTNETSIITLNANGGTIPVTSGWTNASDNKTATKELTYGNEYGELPTPVRTNYLFAGWEDENNNIITSSSTVNNSQAHSLFAKWILPVTVSFNPNGGNVSTSSKTVNFQEQYGTLPIPTRDGYRFVNWKDSNNNVISSSSIVNIQTNHTLTANWEQHFTFVTRQNANQITAGDEVAFASEHFYVLSSNSTNTELIAKYNLLVGDVYSYSGSGWSKTSTLTSGNLGYGLQSSIAKGYYGGYDRTGVVAFSGVGYWDNCMCESNGAGSTVCPGHCGLKSKYANSANPAGATEYVSPYPNIYDSSMSSIAPSMEAYISGSDTWGYAQNNGYTVAYYVNNYINKLKTMGAPSNITGRLLYLSEATNLSSTILGSTSYWLGTSTAWGDAYSVYAGNIGNAYAFWHTSTYGVRPVVTVGTSNLQ